MSYFYLTIIEKELSSNEKITWFVHSPTGIGANFNFFTFVHVQEQIRHSGTWALWWIYSKIFIYLLYIIQHFFNKKTHLCFPVLKYRIVFYIEWLILVQTKINIMFANIVVLVSRPLLEKDMIVKHEGDVNYFLWGNDRTSRKLWFYIEIV